MSNANNTNLAYLEETAYDTLASGGTFKNLRYTGESLKQTTNTVLSNEIRADRQRPDVARVNVGTDGAINFELSYAAYNDFLLAALQASAWSTEVDESISCSHTVGTIVRAAGDFAADGFLANQWIRVEDFTEAGNNGFFKITSVATLILTVTGGTTQAVESAATVRIQQGPQIVNGTTLTSYHIEKEFEDLTNEFELLTGQCIGGVNLNIALETIVSGSFTLLGSTAASGAATHGDGSNTAAAANDVFNCVDHVPIIIEGTGGVDLIECSFALANNLRTRSIIGTLGAESMASGSIDITGTLQAYFEDETLIDKYLNFTESSLAVAFEDAAGNGMLIEFPRIKYTAGERLAGAINEDVIANLEFTAIRDASEDATVRIVNFVT